MSCKALWYITGVGYVECVGLDGGFYSILKRPIIEWSDCIQSGKASLAGLMTIGISGSVRSLSGVRRLLEHEDQIIAV